MCDVESATQQQPGSQETCACRAQITRRPPTQHALQVFLHFFFHLFLRHFLAVFCFLTNLLHFFFFLSTQLAACGGTNALADPEGHGVVSYGHAPP